MINSQDYFETQDFCLAISLLTQGFVIGSFDNSEPKKIKFLFEETETLLKTVNEYWDNRITVNPKYFYNAQKELKTRMYELLKPKY